MKAILTSISFLLIFHIGFAQKIDMVNAPRNPIGFKWKKEHFFLRGDIYASAGKIFDRNGNLKYNYGTRYYYDSNGRITGNNYGDTFEYDSYGNIISFKYKSGSKSTYKFNSNNLLSYEKSSYGDEKYHTYDSKNRLIKTEIHTKGKLTQTRIFNYSRKGNLVIVDMSYSYTNGRQGFTAKSYYRDGFLIKEDVSSGTYNYVVETDKKGNKIDFYDADKPNPKHFKTFNRYYSDANKSMRIEYGYYKLSEKGEKTATVYINGERATDIAMSKGVEPNEKVIYDGLTQTYYSLKNIIPENHTLDTRIPVKNILMSGQPYINYVYDGKFINYVHGYNKVKSRDFSFLGPHMIDYRIDKAFGRTYIIRDYKNKKNQNVKKMELLTTDENSIVYTRELDKENFFIVVKGKHVDYKKARFEYLTNGDPVIFIDNKPEYVLNGFRMAKNNEVLFGKPYNGELDKQSKNLDSSGNSDSSDISSTSNSTGLDCIEGNCENGWGKVTVGDIVTLATFKNSTIDGVAYITYPQNSYYHGEYINNRRHGTGHYKWSSGNTYVGEWKDGKQNGYGYLINSKGDIIAAGLYRDGKLSMDLASDYKAGISNGRCIGKCTDGFGKITYDNGDEYLGFFKNGNRAYIGSYKWSNKSSFIGKWTTDGIRNGYGMYTYVDGSVFKGIFVNDKIDGLGTMLYKNSGNTVKGVFNNKGTKIRDY